MDLQHTDLNVMIVEKSLVSVMRVMLEYHGGIKIK